MATTWPDIVGKAIDTIPALAGIAVLWVGQRKAAKKQDIVVETVHEINTAVNNKEVAEATISEEVTEIKGVAHEMQAEQASVREDLAKKEEKDGMD